MTMPADREREEHIQRFSNLHEYVSEVVNSASGRWRQLSLANLFISVATSGSLWLLFSEALPDSALWAGAVLSTLGTLLTLYIYAERFDQRRTEALRLFRDIGVALGRLRGLAYDPSEDYWQVFKDLEYRYMKLKNPGA